jgi:Ca2+-binding RTX toxin-like protein
MTATTSSFRPTLSALDARECPAVLLGFDAAAGHLHVTFTAGDNVGIGSDNGVVALRTTSPYHHQTPVGGRYIPTAEVRQITVTGSDRADYIYLNGVSRFTFPNLADGRVVVDAGGGHDYVLGSQIGDVIRGGSGNDEVNGHHGNDRLNGGAGNDLVVGGKGDDQLWGGGGADNFVGDEKVISPDWVQPNHGRRDWVRDFATGDRYLWSNGRGWEYTTSKAAWDIEFGVPGKPARPAGSTAQLVALYGVAVDPV